VKLFGMRVDLDRVEDLAGQYTLGARAVEHGGRLHLFVGSHRDQAGAEALGRSLGLPGHVVETHVLAGTPLTSTGKPDYDALMRHAQTAAHLGEDPPTGPITAERVRDLYAHLLGRPDATVDDSFVTLHGDSLSYVEASVRLGRLLTSLPDDWAQLTAQELAATSRASRRSWWAPTETSVILRAAAIVGIVGTHANLLTVMGGAHILLAVAGFNLARLQLSRRPRDERRRGLVRAARNVALPSALWIGGVAVLTGMYDASTALMLNNVLGSDTWDVRWQFWFLEVVVWCLVGASLLVSLPAFDQQERAHPFGVAAAVFGITLVTRYALVGAEAGPTERYGLPVALWCVALGWMATRAATAPQRVLTALAALAGCWGYFGDPVREALVVGGVCALVWLPTVRVPRPLLPLVGVLAASSLFVYLTHWQVYPHLEIGHPLLATLASFAVGIGVWWVYGRLSTAASTAWGRHAREQPRGISERPVVAPSTTGSALVR
jgi:hypothetical protein